MNTQNIRVVLVEDEEDGRITLKKMLLKYCQNIEIVGEASNIQSGIIVIEQQQPDIVFLDVEMPNGNGFELLNSFDEITFEVIFTTAYSQYSIQALRLAALDYLLKPIDIDDLNEALERYRNKQVLNSAPKYSTLKNNWLNQEKKIALPTVDGFEIINLNDIIRCQADGSYTEIITTNTDKIVISKNLKEFASLLDSYFFERVHRSHLINVKYIQKIKKSKNAIIVMKDLKEINVSSHKKNYIIEKYFS